VSVRTITTNKTNQDLMAMDMQDMLAKSMAAAQSNLVQSLMSDAYGQDSVRSKPIIHRRMNRVTTRERTVSYADGYWAKIEINDTDHVTYKVFNSGWLAKTFNKIGFRKVLGNGWDSVKQRDNIEATLGATYMAIDEAIAEDLRKVKHSMFLKEMIKTDPDNLKAIAQLDMLDKGDGPGTEQASTVGQVSAAQPGASIMPKTYGQNITISGSGTYSKADPTKPTAIAVGPTALNAGGATSLSFGNGEEAIKVDPDGGVSFGDEMAKAIKKLGQKGETNGSK